MSRGPAISRRAADAPASPIRVLAPLAAEVKARGTHIYHVNIGQPDLAAPQEILDAIKPPLDGVIPYAPSQGQPATVEAWCDYFATVGVHYAPRDVIVTTGGGEAIGFALVAVADPGDEVLIFDPTYASYLGFAASSNVTLVPVPVAPPDYHLPSPEEIERSITPRTRAIVIVNPSNPTGTVLTREELSAVMDLAQRHNLFVISDETYRELTFDGREHVSAMHFAGMEESVIMVDSVSKRFSATGMRVGVLPAATRPSRARCCDWRRRACPVPPSSRTRSCLCYAIRARTPRGCARNTRGGATRRITRSCRFPARRLRNPRARFT
ncbi:MAG: hypothetical protein NVS2B16_16730 [Chloroflexota bacterium]